MTSEQTFLTPFKVHFNTAAAICSKPGPIIIARDRTRQQIGKFVQKKALKKHRIYKTGVIFFFFFLGAVVPVKNLGLLCSTLTGLWRNNYA